jgi:predicted RecB family endonuclease
VTELFDTPSSADEEIPRDRYGRPLVVPPGGGRPTAYTRCTRYVGVMEDLYNLHRWDERNVALGLADRPDLVLAVSAHRDDKEKLNQIVSDAKEAAKAKAAAEIGTSLHKLTERLDRGQRTRRPLRAWRSSASSGSPCSTI